MTDNRKHDFSARALFRLLDLTTEQADDLVSVIPGSQIGTHHRTGARVGCVSLDSEEIIQPILLFMSRHAKTADSCDIFLSVHTASDTEMWDVPRTVNRMLAKIDCQIVVSFTVT